MKVSTLKYCDCHFGSDLAEVLCKAICWTISLAVILVPYLNADSSLLDSPIALSVMVLSISCFSDIFLSVRKKKKWYAKLFYGVMLFALFYSGFICFLVVCGLKEVPVFFANSLLWIFGLIDAFILLDLFLILCGFFDEPETEPPYPEALNEFMKKLYGGYNA